MRWLLVVLVSCSSRGPTVVTTNPGFDGIGRAVADGRAPETTSVLAMQGGAIVHEAYYNGATADTLHDARSVGKSMTALAVGIAVERGLLHLETPVFAALRAFAPVAHAGPIKDTITVEDLLTMSSALACDDDDAGSVGNERNMYPRDSWVRWAVDLPVATDYARDATGRGPWRYCTAGTLLLGQVLEQVAGQPADRFIAQELLSPLGITRWEFRRSPSGEVMTGGMLRLRTRDLATIAWMTRARGQHGGAQVVPAAFIDAAFTRHRLAFRKQAESYGYLFWHRAHVTPCGTIDAWFMSGNGGNFVGVFAQLDAVVVITRTHFDRGRIMHDQTARLLDQEILPALCRAA